ncbi:thymidine kinase [Erysipelotrichaceae bacterium Oil+RF-744-GAM-WT-6]|jgi:thymidine kinase|uniref:Thymidine kinase n=1 Tax=Stecheria intestinalis TaxID=2606630 RepID=A0A7X2NQR9_9FIRM|nr:thymidine kinase [Stecheria intestinalis]MCI2153352.1 thymidine kinase [Solobacterium sp.]MCI6745624.1 thymidine kinase [Anaerolactibacter massiliensis]MDY3234741.1 thymidine kinase [Erysipelotrichaceae bacterium]MDD5881949.1 thymidine kinase [Stecheria intestinalis]MSS57817.1 thymidine kinase [Stecheria intestinalis]
MAKLYFYYGAMGSSKTANALMVAFNYEERGQKVLIAKSGVDTRDGERIIRSRMGLSRPCVLLEDICRMPEEELHTYDVVIVDEAQFATPEQIDFLAHIVDDLNVPVMCYGLRADFQNKLFPGSERLLTICDEIHEVKTMCWCGRKAICNARYNKHGIVREGAQVMLGANDEYIALCRKHFNEGKLSADDPGDHPAKS